MYSLSILLRTYSQLVATLASKASGIHLCLSSSLLSYGCNIAEIMPRKFQGFNECRFGGFEKDRYFFKIPKWQHKLIQKYKRGKLASYFLDNAVKTCSYELKISENIEIKHVFQSKSIFHHSNSTQVASTPLISNRR